MASASDGGTRPEEVLEAPEEIRRLAFGLVSIEALTVERSAGDRAEAASAMGGVAAHGAASSAQDAALRSELTALANRLQDKDHYDALGVSAEADDDAIRQAYAELAKQAHPDRFHAASSSVRQLASQVFDRISQAYSAIATAGDRQDYARERAEGRKLAALEDEGRRALKAETEYQRGESLLAAREYEAALLFYGRAMEHFPSEGEYRASYGWCLYLCRPDNEIMLGGPSNIAAKGSAGGGSGKPYLLLSRLYKAMGKPVAAKMFSRARAIKPQCVEAMRELPHHRTCGAKKTRACSSGSSDAGRRRRASSARAPGRGGRPRRGHRHPIGEERRQQRHRRRSGSTGKFVKWSDATVHVLTPPSTTASASSRASDAMRVSTGARRSSDCPAREAPPSIPPRSTSWRSPSPRRDRRGDARVVAPDHLSERAISGRSRSSRGRRDGSASGQEPRAGRRDRLGVGASISARTAQRASAPRSSTFFFPGIVNAR
ncbi:MAG: J domain-containing protein [Myxococcota bacterium]